MYKSVAEYGHILRLQEKDVTLSWVGQISADPARVYAVAFTSPNEIVLDSGGPYDPYRWIPRGGIEPGETPEQALRRELREEADAAIEAKENLGSQHMVDSQGRREYHRYYWCLVMLTTQTFPTVESTLRHIIAPDAFLDTLQ